VNAEKASWPTRIASFWYAEWTQFASFHRTPHRSESQLDAERRIDYSVYTVIRFDWDKAKNQSNRSKHGISFETAILIFDDPHVLSELERVIDGEERWQSLGLVDGVLLILVAHTWTVSARG
jgi:uncharacterized DUF497 family protein